MYAERDGCTDQMGNASGMHTIAQFGSIGGSDRTRMSGYNSWSRCLESEGHDERFDDTNQYGYAT